ncbi:MAG: hypothetical protein KC561_14840, partial [Myxococcales bacterium]|nr:hypothetical protein [Myxococcales bacterium]
MARINTAIVTIAIALLLVACGEFDVQEQYSEVGASGLVIGQAGGSVRVRMISAEGVVESLVNADGSFQVAAPQGDYEIEVLRGETVVGIAWIEMYDFDTH